MRKSPASRAHARPVVFARLDKSTKHYAGSRIQPALWHSRAGIVASNTATVEAAMMQTPFVMVYCVSSLTYLRGKPRVKVPHLPWS